MKIINKFVDFMTSRTVGLLLCMFYAQQYPKIENVWIKGTILILVFIELAKTFGEDMENQ